MTVTKMVVLAVGVPLGLWLTRRPFPPKELLRWMSNREEDILGFCEQCFRMRWLAQINSFDDKGNPYGICRSCKRENDEKGEEDADREVRHHVTP